MTPEYFIRILELSNEEIYFYATHAGAELDLFFVKNGKNWGIEIKYQDAPKKTKSLHACSQANPKNVHLTLTHTSPLRSQAHA